MGIVEGIISDNEINLKEVENLNKWMAKNTQLPGTYFYEHLNKVVKEVLVDGILDDNEKLQLKILLTFLLKDNNLNRRIEILKFMVGNMKMILLN